ncbi:MAG: hypothetical protein J6Y02_00865 [Pseudobutyrivibrio sp.]|nr:hypothetical protein [Pseudobutyrivibrio sp.]
MSNNEILFKVKRTIRSRFPNQEVVKIIDYPEKSIYVVWVVPKGLINNKDEWMDSLYAIDKDTFKFYGSFNPLANDPDTYFNLSKDQVIFELQ